MHRSREGLAEPDKRAGHDALRASVCNVARQGIDAFCQPSVGLASYFLT
jgi:hypothetical protein